MADAKLERQIREAREQIANLERLFRQRMSESVRRQREAELREARERLARLERTKRRIDKIREDKRKKEAAAREEERRRQQEIGRTGPPSSQQVLSGGSSQPPSGSTSGGGTPGGFVDEQDRPRFPLPSSSGGSSGSAGGTPTSPSGASAPAQTGGGGATPSRGASPTDVEEYINTHYPQFAWLTRDPEMMGLFRQAMEQEWSPVKFQLELQKSAWWKNRSETVRHWEALRATDPASADRLLVQQLNLMADAAMRLGADVTPQVLRQLAENAIRFGWDSAQIDDALVNHVSFADPKFGLAAGAKQRVRGMAGQYAVPLSEREQQRWARRLLTGEATDESMQAYFVEQAKSMFPTLAGALERGITVRQYADPYIQIAAQDLEMTPEQIDLLDPKWSRPLLQVNEKGERVQMDLAEWREVIRSDDRYRWKETSQARDASFQMVDALGKVFGAVA